MSLDKGRSLPPGCTQPEWPTDRDMEIWRACGGSQHGPNVETATIPLAYLGRFVSCIRANAVQEAIKISADIGRQGMGDFVAAELRRRHT